MEGKRFDQLARTVATSGSRRRVLAGLLAGALGGLRIHATSADDDGIAIADASGGNDNLATAVDAATGGNGHDNDNDQDTCAKSGELRKDGKPCCNDLVKDDDGRCVRPESSDDSHGGGGGDGGCDSSTCPADQSTNSTGPGHCCDDGFCSCGGECCGGPDCWIFRPDTPDEEDPIVIETCTRRAGCLVCPNSGGACCANCTGHGDCVSPCIECPGAPSAHACCTKCNGDSTPCDQVPDPFPVSGGIIRRR